jgi:hypothetical protein
MLRNGGTTLARDPDKDALAVEEKQVVGEVGVLEGLQAFALVCTATPDGYREPLVRRLVMALITVYAPDGRGDVASVDYQQDAAGISVKDVGRGGGTVVFGDEALWRVALGGFVQVGEEIRGAASALAAVDFSASRPAIVWVGGERVRVKSAAQARDAERIVKLLKESYGVTFDSVAARREVRKDKAERGRSADDVRAYDAAPWSYADLQDLEAGFKYFAPILGKARTKSARKSSPQEVVRLGRLSSVRTAEAQYLKDSGTIAVYQSRSDIMAPDEGTVVHEIAHAIFGPLVEEFRTKIGYWTHRGDPSSEAPPTPYGATSPDEDLADSVSLFFTAPDALKSGMRGKKRGEVGNACPKRFRWIEAEVARWKPARP